MEDTFQNILKKCMYMHNKDNLGVQVDSLPLFGKRERTVTFFFFFVKCFLSWEGFVFICLNDG